jgi:hypothetical protein
MKNGKKQFVMILSIFLLVGLITTPMTFAQEKSTLTRADQLRNQIEDGYSQYLQTKNIQLTSNESNEKAFREFLRSNSIYSKCLSEYSNLTKPDINKLLPGTGIDLSTVVKGAPSKTLSTVINGKTYQVCCCPAESADGQRCVIVTMGGNGTDPSFYIQINYLTINILGFIVTYGEDQYYAVEFYDGSEADTRQNAVNQGITQAQGFEALVWAAYDVACVLSGAAVGAVASLQAFIDEYNLDMFSNEVTRNNANDGTHGFWMCLENKVIYPIYMFVALPDFSIWIRQWYGSNGVWEKAYPLFVPYWETVIIYGIPAAEANAWALSIVIHTIGDLYYYDTWFPILDPPTPGSPPSGPDGLLYPDVECYDDQSNQIDANVHIDGFNIGTTTSLRITPETHYVGVDQYIPTSGGYGYIFNYMTIEGDNYYSSEAEVALSTSSTITAHYTYGLLPTFDVTVKGWEEVYCTEIYPDIYLNGDYYGTCEIYDTLPVGYYTFVADQYYDQFVCNYVVVTDGGQYMEWGNSVSLYLTSTTTIDFYYTG